MTACLLFVWSQSEYKNICQILSLQEVLTYLYRNLLCTITINNGPTLLGHTAYRFNFALVKSWLSPSVLFKPQVYFHKTCNFLLSIGESVWWLLDLFLAGSQHQFISSRSVKFHFYSRCANWIKYTHSFLIK